MAVILNDNALCSLSEVRRFISVEYDKINVENENTILDLINNISATIETYCDRKFHSQEYTEYHDGAGGYRLYTNNYPITTVSGVYDDTSWTFDDATLIDSTYYKISNNNNSILFNGVILSDYIENVKVIYTAGYTTIPSDLKDCCIREVARTYAMRKDIHLYSKTMADGSVERYQGGFLPSTKQTLSSYIKYRVV